MHYVWLMKHNLTQGQYYKKEMTSHKPLSTTSAIRKVASIMLHLPPSPIPPAQPPYSPFCYLPPGSFSGAFSPHVCLCLLHSTLLNNKQPT